MIIESNRYVKYQAGLKHTESAGAKRSIGSEYPPQFYLLAAMAYNT